MELIEEIKKDILSQKDAVKMLKKLKINELSRVLTFETSKKRTYVNIGSFFAGVP